MISLIRVVISGFILFYILRDIRIDNIAGAIIFIMAYYILGKLIAFVSLKIYDKRGVIYFESTIPFVSVFFGIMASGVEMPPVNTYEFILGGLVMAFLLLDSSHEIRDKLGNKWIASSDMSWLAKYPPRDILDFAIPIAFYAVLLAFGTFRIIKSL